MGIQGNTVMVTQMSEDLQWRRTTSEERDVQERTKKRKKEAKDVMAWGN